MDLIMRHYTSYTFLTFYNTTLGKTNAASFNSFRKQNAVPQSWQQ